jgi:arsenite transporter
MSVVRSRAGVPPTPPVVVRRVAGVGRHLVVLVPAAMLLGFVAGRVADLSGLKVLVLPMTVLMVYPMMIGFRPGEAFTRTDGRAIGMAMALNFLVLPAIAWVLAGVFFDGEPGLFVGMVLAGLFPTSGMTISWTGFAKGNVRAAVKMTVIGLLLASLLAPVYLLLLAGRVVRVDLWGVLGTVLFVVVVPMVAGWVTRVGLTRRLGVVGYQRVAPAFPGLSTIGVLGIVFIAIALKAPMIADRPGLLARIAVPIVAFYLINYLVAIAVGRFAVGRGDAIAIVYGTVMRNLSIALGVAMTSFGPEAALVLAAAFIVQVQSAAWSVHLTDRIFGPARNATATARLEQRSHAGLPSSRPGGRMAGTNSSPPDLDRRAGSADGATSRSHDTPPDAAAGGQGSWRVRP